MAVFITGDTHGDFTRFKKDIFFEQTELTKDDYVIICGDFGGLWDDSPKERWWLDWLEEKPFTTLFVIGNHENYDLLAGYPVSQWHGGQVQYIRPSILHLMRGQVYDICGKRYFTMGGASSHDIADGILEPDDPQFRQKFKRLNQQGALFRVNRRSWWAEELPSVAEYAAARDTLERTGWEVDYIVTHCCPTSVQDADYFDVSMDYLYCRTDEPRGKLYNYQPQILMKRAGQNEELRDFIEMCFDPKSPVNERLKEALFRVMEEGKP